MTFRGIVCGKIEGLPLSWTTPWSQWRSAVKKSATGNLTSSDWECLCGAGRRQIGSKVGHLRPLWKAPYLRAARQDTHVTSTPIMLYTELSHQVRASKTTFSFCRRPRTKWILSQNVTHGKIWHFSLQKCCDLWKFLRFFRCVHLFLMCSVFFVCYCVNCVLCLWLPLRRNKDIQSKRRFMPKLLEISDILYVVASSLHSSAREQRKSRGCGTWYYFPRKFCCGWSTKYRKCIETRVMWTRKTANRQQLMILVELNILETDAQMVADE